MTRPGLWKRALLVQAQGFQLHCKAQYKLTYHQCLSIMRVQMESDRRSMDKATFEMNDESKWRK